MLNYLFRNRQDACEARKFISCGMGILPVLDNGARFKIQRTFQHLRAESRKSPPVIAKSRSHQISSLQLRQIPSRPSQQFSRTIPRQTTIRVNIQSLTQSSPELPIIRVWVSRQTAQV